ncbi:G-type lectin S-receptor serine/threonine-protein kinase [Salix suchowensis]|nr:G-type lectin S-receptor serine/threonine-protein kinase [Salix suchowensis]
MEAEKLFLLFSLIMLQFSCCASQDSLKSNQTIKEGHLLISKGNNFALGFFSPGSSSNRYLGIWYYKVPEKTVVWVANRNDPIIGSSGFLFINQHGNLVLYGNDDQKLPVWSTYVSVEENDCCEAQLLDSGNLIMVTKRSSSIIWQSFDHPTNTLLPGMKLGLDRKLGIDRFLTSWRSADDPGTGDFSLRINPNGLPGVFLYNGIDRFLISWRSADDPGTGDFSARINPNGSPQFFFYNGTKPIGRANTWPWRSQMGLYKSTFVSDPDEIYTLYTTSSVCDDGEGFVKIENYGLPDTSNVAWVDKITSRIDCELQCKRNCSCSAYSIIGIPGKGDACLTWYKELVDITYEKSESNELQVHNNSIELEYFKLSTITAATNNFSPANKLGQGGFGSVYKLRGLLANGQEVAVKRLSRSSGQGTEEFKNEVMVIAKLQHRNLVKLLGYCIQNEEQMLIYEYLPNKSLDWFLFDETRKLLLDWRKRFNIIVGIARGILYLHQDSRLRIIHRDLKCSNILLDAEMNPKISDFGMAKIFEGNQTEDRTRRVVGTYGYMSPKYVVFGNFSVKSDVFSFGVMLLEIVSGKKNNRFYQQDPPLTLIGYVWELWRQDKALEIVDPSMNELYSPREALKFIRIGLLCVQEDAMDRPSMLAVVFMLSSETEIPCPKQPAFLFRKPDKFPDIALNVEDGLCSVNQVTISEIASR